MKTNRPGRLVAVVIPVIAFVVPAMIVGDAAVVAIPIDLIVKTAIVTGLHPMRACICRSGVVAFVPSVMVVHRIPVAADPGVSGSRALWLNAHCAHRRRCANSDADADLSEDCTGGEEYQGK